MNLKRHILFVLFLNSLSFINCKEDKKTIRQTKVSFTKEGKLSIYKFADSTQITIDIEIADTDFDIQTGLMYRDSMENNQGMLFVFENDEERFFYMKNTKITLDLVYINSNKKVASFQKNTKPFDESSLPSDAPAKYVLEINAGLVDLLSISVGDSLSFSEY